MFDVLAPILIFLITAGVKDFFTQVLKATLPDSASAIIVALVAFLILFANALGGLIPAAQLPLVSQIVSALVAVFSAFGVRATIRYFAPSK